MSWEYIGPPPDPRALPTEEEWEWLSDWYGYPNYHEGRTLWAFLINEITESQEDESRGLKIRLWQYKLLDDFRAREKALKAENEQLREVLEASKTVAHMFRAVNSAYGLKFAMKDLEQAIAKTSAE